MTVRECESFRLQGIAHVIRNSDKLLIQLRQRPRVGVESACKALNRPRLEGSMKVLSFTLGVLSSCILAVSPTPALGQHGGGGSGNSGGAHASAGAHSAVSPSHSSSAPTNNSRGGTGDHPSVVAFSGRSNRSTTSRVSTAGDGHGSSEGPAPNDTWLNNRSEGEDPARVATIGFPRSDGESHFADSGSESHTIFAGESGAIRAEHAQQGTRPAATVPARRPATAPNVAAPAIAQPTPAARPRTLVLVRPMHQVQNRRPLWFLAAQPDVTVPHVWRRGFRSGLGIGLFGFGVPFAFGFGPDCNPFWAEPWAFGCNSFGYLDGFGGYGEGYQQEPSESTEQPAQEEPAEQSIYIPPQESSPEEVQAEKILFVLYMKNGAVYAVTNYWIADGKLHYLTSYGGENTIEMNDLDLQKTVDVNTKRGVDFTLKPRPDQNQQNVPQQ